jgi:hypothetical protein
MDSENTGVELNTERKLHKERTSMKKNWRILFSLALIGALCMLVPPSNIQANQKLTMEYAGKTSNIPAANGKIAFYSMRDGNFEIYKMNGDGNNLVRLTNNAARWTENCFPI